MTNDSIKLAHLWVELAAVKDKIDNEILPLAAYLDAADDNMIAALETTSAEIERHFKEFKLIAATIKR